MFAVFPPALPAPVRPRVVALLNQKGGVGKTTSTVNLGAALARFGRRVLLVDLDPQSNLSLHFGVEASPEQPTVHDLLMDPQVRLEDVVLNARPGLDFVPAVTELALVEGEMAQRPGMQSVLRDKLEPGFSRYDAILLDCPPSLGVLSVNALTVADEVFVPMQAHYLPLRGLEKLLQTVHLVAQGLNPAIRVGGVLLCMHDGTSSHAKAVIDEIEAQFAQYRAQDVPWSDARVLAPPVRRNIKLAEAPSFGMTIFDYAPRCPGADDYRDLARALLERWGVAVPVFEGAPAPGRRVGAELDAGAGTEAETEPRAKRRRARSTKASRVTEPKPRRRHTERMPRKSKAASRDKAGPRHKEKAAARATAKPVSKRAAKLAARSVAKPAAKAAPATKRSAGVARAAPGQSRSNNRPGSRTASKPGKRPARAPSKELATTAASKHQPKSAPRPAPKPKSRTKSLQSRSQTQKPARGPARATARTPARAIARAPARAAARRRSIRSGGLSL